MHTSPGVSVSEAASCCPHHVRTTDADAHPYDARGAEQLVDAWLAEHGDNEVDDDGSTLRDYLECFPEIRDDLERRIARALGSAYVDAREQLRAARRDVDEALDRGAVSR
jgi:hypothetical protein